MTRKFGIPFYSGPFFSEPIWAILGPYVNRVISYEALVLHVIGKIGLVMHFFEAMFSMKWCTNAAGYG